MPLLNAHAVLIGQTLVKYIDKLLTGTVHWCQHNTEKAKALRSFRNYGFVLVDAFQKENMNFHRNSVEFL